MRADIGLAYFSGPARGMWPVEAFVATQHDWHRHVGAEVSRRLPVVLHLTATGLPLVDSDLSDRLQGSARALYDSGPRWTSKSRRSHGDS